MLRFVFWAAVAGMAGSVALVAGVRLAASRRLLLDYPNERSLHVRATPRGGGIGIVVPVFAGIATVGALIPEARGSSACLAGVGLLIATLGLVDDLRSLSPLVRLFTHVCAAAIVAAGIGVLSALEWPGIGSVDLRWLGIPATILVVVGLTNAYNFMDGVDGIAGGQAVVAGVGWAIVGYVAHDPLITITGTIIAAASAGFLFFNWPPASIFMGDVGSSFLGFLLAALIVYVGTRAPSIATAGALFVWPFVFDTVFTFVRRARRGENLLRAHRSHLYQRLVLTGVSHRDVTLLYIALAVVGVLVGNAVAREAKLASIAGAVIIGILAMGLCISVAWLERSVARQA